jgi:hypothetical protein
MLLAASLSAATILPITSSFDNGLLNGWTSAGGSAPTVTATGGSGPPVSGPSDGYLQNKDTGQIDSFTGTSVLTFYAPLALFPAGATAGQADLSAYLDSVWNINYAIKQVSAVQASKLLTGTTGIIKIYGTGGNYLTYDPLHVDTKSSLLPCAGGNAANSGCWNYVSVPFLSTGIFNYNNTGVLASQIQALDILTHITAFGIVGELHSDSQDVVGFDAFGIDTPEPSYSAVLLLVGALGYAVKRRRTKLS